MSTEENKAIIRRYFDERWNHENLDVCDELLPVTADIAGIKDWHRSMYASFGQRQMTILDLLAEGSQVAIHWRFTATHQGDYLGVAATGKPINFQGIAWLRVVDGKIVEDTAYSDNLAILQQLGATTIPAAETS